MIEKEKILEAYIKMIEKKVEDLKQSLEKTKRSAEDAVASMVSWSDTTKFQQSNLSLGIQKRLMEVKQELYQLKTLTIAANDVISVGALSSLKNIDDGEITNYFLVPKGGGDSLDIEGKKMIIISALAPLARVMIGKKKNEKVTFGGKVLKIINVQ